MRWTASRSRLEIDRHEKARAAELHNQGDVLLGKHREELVRGKIATTNLEREPDQGKAAPVRALADLAAARKLALSDNDLLYDNGHTRCG